MKPFLILHFYPTFKYGKGDKSDFFESPVRCLLYHYEKGLGTTTNHPDGKGEYQLYHYEKGLGTTTLATISLFSSRLYHYEKGLGTTTYRH